GARNDFTQFGTMVELEKWRDDFSHARHLRYVGGGPALAELTAWEVPGAVAELSGEKPATAEKTPSPGPVAAPPLSIAGLLGSADIKGIPGFGGTFDVSRLTDEPASPTYDSLHLQARGREESFDVAVRLWHLTPDGAGKQYQRLLDELPGIQEKNELGDKSLRATSEKGDILAAAYMDLRRGTVVLIQSGASQCRSHDVALQILRLIKERADAKFGGQTK